MKFMITTAAFLVGATGAMAQGLTGGTVGFDYKDYNDIDDGSTTRFHLSAEFEVANGIALAADLSSRSYEDFDENSSNVMLHAIYAVSPDVSVGAYIGRETIEDTDVENYGAEVAYISGPVSLEAYFGTGEVQSLDLTYTGVLGDYALGNGFSVLGGIERIGVDSGSSEGDYTQLEIGGAYAFAEGATIYAKAGQVSVDFGGTSEEESFLGIGASFSFGSDGGTTFSPRGLLDIAPVSSL